MISHQLLRFNEEVVKGLPIPERGSRVHFFAGAVLQGQPAPRGFGVRVSAGGVRAFVLDYRMQQRQYRYTIGQYPDWSALRAVREARVLRQRIDRGENPMADRSPPPPAVKVKTVSDVLDEFMVRYVRSPARPLRSAKEYESAFDRLVKPAIGTTPIYELRRSAIVEMLDSIADRSGAGMADRTLAYLRKALNWYSARDDGFNTPIVKGMARTQPSERARDRVLSDDEICLIWAQLTGTFGAIVKALLLTAQRRDEVGEMQHSEIDQSGVWTIPSERYKGGRAQVVPLSAAALGVIQSQPKRSNYIFTGRTGITPFSGYSKAKVALDKAVARANESPLPGWRLHDLRRTARSLMSRASVRPDIAERVLGHAIPGVEGVYDRHSYLAEKCDALEKLAQMIEHILNPPGQS